MNKFDNFISEFTSDETIRIYVNKLENSDFGIRKDAVNSLDFISRHAPEKASKIEAIVEARINRADW